MMFYKLNDKAFMVTKKMRGNSPDSLYPLLEILISSCAKDDPRLFMNRIYAHGNNTLMSTDGHIACVIDTTGFNFGHNIFYKPIVVGGVIHLIKDEINKYEFPVKDIYKIFDQVKLNARKRGTVDKQYDISLIAYEVMSSFVCCDIRYLNKLKPIKFWNIYMQGDCEPMLFESEDCRCYTMLMPIKR